jgi:LmbE family N-acetylglucosaminyl deacetylase
MRMFAGWSAVAGVAFAMVGGAAMGQELHDPANLAGERVRPSVTERNIPANVGAAALQQSLVKLRTRASLMMIVAHPDDEDGGMLAYEARGQGAHVAVLTLTRGEGGQNLMSGDFDDALGLVRTQELLAADRYMGVDQMFGTEVDFGFSKTKEEALAKWTHERVLYDAVRAVRLFRPLVVTSVFVGGLTDGHGQHQVSGEMAQEVFDAAGDPKMFPDQIAAGLMPWSPMKVYGRAPFARVTNKEMFDYATGKYAPARFYNYVTKEWTTEPPKANVTIPEGESSPALGMSYVQFARKGLALQKTQIGQGVRLAPAGAYDVNYHRYGSRVKTTDKEQNFFDGVDVTLEGIATLAPSAESWLRPALKTIDDHAAMAAKVFSADTPEKCSPELRDGLKALDSLIAKVNASGLPAVEKTNVLHELKVKRTQFNNALVQALGLRVEARMMAKGDACSDAVTPGCAAHVSTQVINGGRQTVEVTADFVSPSGVSLSKEHTWAPGTAKIEPGKTLDSFFEYRWPGNVVADGASNRKKDPTTRPYFSKKNAEQTYYDVSDPALRLAPQTPPESFWVRVNYDGVPLLLGQEVLAPDGKVDEADRPMVVVPSLSVAIRPSAGIIPLTEKSFTVSVEVRGDEQRGVQGTARLALPQGWHSEPASAQFSFDHAGESKTFLFRVTPVALAETSYTLKAVAETKNGTTSEGFRAVGYKGLTPTNIYASAIYRARGVNVKVAPGLKVGYLPGTGDDVQASLENLGVHATTLTVDDIAGGRLAGYDAVVLGVRAYAAHPELAAANGQLLNYAKSGGVLIVQYNLTPFNYGPYPYSMGDAEKVVDETAPVQLLMSENPMLSWPNKITTRDFDGWVEERGHGFMESWGPEYAAPLETHDPGQDPQKGSLLVAKTGKGAYVYVALALYRQLPEGVPGAYRLFANLLSLGKDKAAK